MANEITYNQTSGTMSFEYRVARENFLEAFYANAAGLLPHLMGKSLAGFPSTTERFTKKPKLTAASIADGVDLTNSPYTPTQVPLTVGEVGVQLTQTDLNSTSSLLSAADQGMEMGQAIAEKLLSDVAGLGGGFSSSVGSTTNNLTEAQFLSARTTLILNRIPEPYVAVLYPQQEEDLIVDIGTTLASIIGSGGPTVLSETNQQVVRLNRPREILGTLVISTDTVPTANAGADSAGFMFGSKRAIGYVQKWATRMEEERDISLRATERVGTAAYAVGEVDDDAGVGIITDR